MSTFKAGDKVIRTVPDESSSLQVNNLYTVSRVSEGGYWLEIEGFEEFGVGFDADNFRLFYQEPAQKTFNPKPGDLIVTNNGKSYRCMSHEEYCRFGDWSADFAKEFTIFGWRTDSISPRYFCHMRWLGEDGKVEGGAEFDIKEIIPAPVNNPVAFPQPPQDLSFQVKALELENQMLRKLLRREGVEV